MEQPQASSTPSFINPADAIRLAACWNAFVGLSTSDIEQVVQNKGPLAQKMVRDDAERDQLRAELAAAHALLGEVLALQDAANIGTMSGGEPDTTNDFDFVAERIRALLKGGAA